MAPRDARRGWLSSAALLAATVMGCSSPAADPTGDRFTALPDICGLVSPATIHAFVGERARTDPFDIEDTGSCTWIHRNRDVDTENTKPFERVLSLNVVVHRTVGTASGSDTAKLHQRMQSDDMPGALTDEPGIGDGAMLYALDGQSDAIITADNLYLWITYSGRDFNPVGEPVSISRQQATEVAILTAREITQRLERLPR
ncbi:hypothetical protein [Saccharopolyspora elongata]|uniref:DUF3558 domain-containing protein n=1 Tax=Saccharopolyspora elongata TaxID=2530387 RepID=A0A4R4Y936_9PSEU|nr:hypothetical protein [Saccharopolyspora elongata]TDD40284.1 hypothetical protein E1288_35735 [Saccharopolyspora elongata]